jgi:hypothetical protein
MNDSGPPRIGFNHSYMDSSPAQDTELWLILVYEGGDVS